MKVAPKHSKQSKPSTQEPSVIPAEAILSTAENRNLYKPEPPRAALCREEHFLLMFYRKLSQGDRLKVNLMASDLALARIRSRLAKGRARHAR